VSARERRELSFDGELTILTAAEHHRRLRLSLADGVDLHLDLSGVSEIDTAGLQVLLIADRAARQLGAVLTLGEPSPAVRDVLAIPHLDAEFNQTEPGPKWET
jgi:anti-anti-sigma factor